MAEKQRVSSRWWRVIGFVKTILVGSILIEEPNSSRFRRPSGRRASADAERLRRQGRRFTACETGIGVAVLARLMMATTYTPSVTVVQAPERKSGLCSHARLAEGWPRLR